MAIGSTPKCPRKRRSSAEIVAWSIRGATRSIVVGMRSPALASRSRTFPCASRTTVPGTAPRDSGASSGAKRAYAVSDSDAKPMTMTSTRAEPRIGGKHG